MNAMRFGFAVTVTAVLTITAGTGVAYAQVNPAAEQAFRDGKRFMSERRHAEACDSFATSQRLEPNLATLMSLADCRQKNGQLATAWALFLEAEQQTRDASDLQDLHATADARSIELEPRLSYITVNVPDESRLKGLVVYRNGEVIDPGLWNRAVPVDGGPYRIEAKAPGHEPWLTEVMVSPERDRQAVEVPRFKNLPAMLTSAATLEPSVAESSAPPPPPRSDGPNGTFTKRRKLAIGFGAAAVAAFAGSISIWSNARAIEDEAFATCLQTACSETEAQIARDLNDDARQRALYGNLVFGVGIGAAVLGGYLWVTGDPARRSIAIVPQLGAVTGLAATGAF